MYKQDSDSSSSSEESEELPVTALKELIKLLKEVTRMRSKDPKRKSINTSLLKFIGQYERLLSAPSFDFKKDHAPLFEEIFRRSRKSFLNVLKDDTFMRNTVIQVWYGENSSMKSRNCRLPISSCLSSAYDLRQMKMKEMNGDPDVDGAVMATANYIIYGEIKYFFMKVISLSIVDEASLKKLGDIIEELRLDTSLPEGEEEPPGTSLGSVVGTIMDEFGDVSGGDEDNGKEVREQINKAKSSIKETMDDKVFAGDLMKTVKEIGNSGGTIPEKIKASLEAATPLIESLIEKNKVAPSGVTPVTDKKKTNRGKGKGKAARSPKKGKPKGNDDEEEEQSDESS